MKTVKRMADIEMLQEKGELSKAYINFLEEYFLQLFESFGEGEDLDAFSLEHDGYIVILEPRDNLLGSEKASEVRLRGSSFPPKGDWYFPQFVESVLEGAGTDFYTTIIYSDNQQQSLSSSKRRALLVFSRWCHEE